MMPQIIDKLSSINDLNKLLIEMMKYGKPRVSCVGQGEWFCSIDMWITGVEIEFSIKSDFKHKTPLEAAFVCANRMNDAFKSLK